MTRPAVQMTSADFRKKLGMPIMVIGSISSVIERANEKKRIITSANALRCNRIYTFRDMTVVRMYVMNEVTNANAVTMPMILAGSTGLRIYCHKGSNQLTIASLPTLSFKYM